MTTYAILKRKVANRLGKTDNATANTIRDNCIKDAYTQICQDRWSWTLKSDTLTVSSGVANMPSDFNPSAGIVYACYEVTGDANDKPYIRVDVRELDNYTDSERVYFLTYSSGYWVFNSNQDSDTVKVYYHYIPTELSDDADVCIVPDDMAVVYLAAAMWWLAKERDEANYDRFYAKYLERRNEMLALDKAYNSTRTQLKTKLDDDDRESILATER